MRLKQLNRTTGTLVLHTPRILPPPHEQKQIFYQSNKMPKGTSGSGRNKQMTQQISSQRKKKQNEQNKKKVSHKQLV